jgi:hypothetical protein
MCKYMKKALIAALLVVGTRSRKSVVLAVLG